MLVITLGVGDNVRIGDAIKVKITGADGRRVKLGVDAPRTISIQRVREDQDDRGRPNQGLLRAYKS